MKYILVFLLFINICYAKKLTLGATNWCPYTCPSMKNKGIVSEFIIKILKEQGISLEIVFLPWNRAISLSKVGQIDGLLTGVYEEAPHLAFTKTPTMSYQSCIFSILDDQKVSLKDLSSKKIGVVDSYSYGKTLDKFLSGLSNDNKHVLKGSSSIKRFFKLAQTERIDYFVEDKYVVNYTIPSMAYPVYCGEENPFFIGLNQKLKNKDELLKLLNTQISKNRSLLFKIINNSK